MKVPKNTSAVRNNGDGPRVSGQQEWCTAGVGRQMGERGKSEEMKSRKTNLRPVEPVEPDSDQPESQDSMGRGAQKPEVRLGREAQARIGEQLRAMYNSFVNQGVPVHLVDLVRRLGEQD